MLFFFLGGLLRGTGVAVAIVAAVIAVATVAAIACSGALGVIAAVLLAGIIRIICLCGVGGVHSAAAHIGVTGAACRIIGRGIVVFPFVLIHIDTSFPEKALSPGNCAPWNCSYCIHQL